MKTYFDKITGKYLGNTNYEPSDPDNPWRGHIAIEGMWNAEFMFKGTKVIPDPDFVPPSDPGDELNAALTVLKGTGASVDDLINLMLGAGGKARIAGRPV